LNFQISLAHVATKQFAEAIKDYNILAEMNPDEAKYYYNRGIAEYSMGNKDAAIDDFKRTLSMPVTPQDVQFHMDVNSAQDLSIIYKEKGDLKTSAEYAQTAQKLGYK
jgi:tetratricopeptide (TPR) repeat protein